MQQQHREVVEHGKIQQQSQHSQTLPEAKCYKNQHTYAPKGLQKP